jgi:uncharacterized phage-associated protein
MKTPFDIQKAAQVAHFFITKADGHMHILKLVKLIYLADRHSIEKRRTPIVGGTYYALPHGPVTSEVLNLIDDGTPEGSSAWEQLVSDRADHMVATNGTLEDYDALAPSEIQLLEEIWNEFGQMDRWALRDWTHQHCVEWSDPNGARNEILARHLAESFAWNDSEISDFETESEAQFRLHALIADCRA